MTEAVKIGLVQINNSFSGQNYLPYSVACLESYVKEHADDPERYHFLSPVYKREPIHKIVDHVKDADIVGFSTYVWNAEISLEVARRLRALNPEITILFGGPQVPDQAGEFLRVNSFIDLCLHNEGERKFLAFLQTWPGRDYSDLGGASFVDADGIYHRNEDGPRIKDLEEVPSPFLNGMFDKLIEDNPEESWIGLWETNRGCPFKCTFCDWGSATAAKLNKFEDDRLDREIEWFAENRIEYIFTCDANFGILKRDIDIAKKVAAVKETTGYPVALSVQNTKNATDRAYEAQKILSDAGLNKGVALSMQSVDETTLDAIKRGNISLETYWTLQQRFTRDKVETYSDLILGLPGETYDSFVEGVDVLIRNGQHNRIQFNNCSILPNAEMGNPEYQKLHGIKTVRSEIVNIHGSRVVSEDDVAEWQDLIIATNSTPEADWRRVRAFSWMTAFLHFDKILQMPLIIAHEVHGLRYRDLLEAFIDPARIDTGATPLIAKIADFFESEAKRIQDGGVEYVFSEEWLGIFWPADEYVFIQLAENKEMDAFYEEAAGLLENLILEKDDKADLSVLRNAVKANKALVSQPFVSDDLAIKLDYNILTFYDGVRTGDNIALDQKATQLDIQRSARHYDDFGKWCQEVVWWGNKKGAYLYGRAESDQQLAGHF